jgi:photosystem II stability/assembly factor-like uncharacterized protein
MKNLHKIAVVLVSLAVTMSGLIGSTNHGIHNLAHAQGTTQGEARYFQETGHTVKGRFLEYWQQNGGLFQQGYPITGEMQEVSETNGRTYTVQYFERAVFEYHPENQRPYDVLLSLLGVFEYGKRYGAAGAPNQQPNNSPGSIFFPETGKRLGGKFLEYWRTHGGLMQQGFPISDEFTEISALNGKPYTVQYFQRAVFELHPENAGTPYEVLLSHLGTFRYRAKYQAQQPVTPPTTETLYDVHMLGDVEGWAVGAKGTILHYINGRWEKVASPVTTDLRSIDMLSPTEGWAVGTGTILRYTGGKWQAVESRDPGAYYASIDMVSPTEGWIVGGGPGPGFILHYTNGSWQFSDQFNTGKHALNDVHMLSANEGWAVGNGVIARYVGAGRWETQERPDAPGLRSVRMVTPSEGLAVGTLGTVLRYSEGKWEKVPADSSLSLTSVDMVSRLEGWAVSESGQILHYMSPTLSPEQSPTREALLDVDMVSRLEGWAVGSRGTILHYQNGTWNLYAP